MKCKSCGANYRSRELRCPYCGAENAKGKLWKAQRDSAEQQYRELEQTEGAALRLRAANRVLNRALLFEGIALGVFLVGVFLWFMLGEAVFRVRRSVKADALSQQMQQLYAQQQLGELYRLMDEYDLFGDENYEYAQAALLHKDYAQFDLARCEFFAVLQRGEQPDEYLTWKLVNSMNEILVPYISAYPRITENNAQLQQQYSADVLEFAQGWLGFGKEETALLYSDWLTTEQETLLQQKIAEVAA
ncbi:MAG: hypothetical protein IKV55_07305 [Oscillospiraceae bacterium]|nr:hypothetical protein [Oscillospiraceae bacterium]